MNKSPDVADVADRDLVEPTHELQRQRHPLTHFIELWRHKQITAPAPASGQVRQRLAAISGPWHPLREQRALRASDGPPSDRLSRGLAWPRVAPSNRARAVWGGAADKPQQPPRQMREWH